MGQVLSLEVTADEWKAELDRLTRAVHRWFSETGGGQFKVPDFDQCAMVAFYIAANRDHPRFKKKRRLNLTELYAGRFRKRLIGERNALKRTIKLATLGMPRKGWLEVARAQLATANEVLAGLEKLLPTFSSRPDAGTDPVRAIAALATEAWQAANGGKAPASKNPDAALCQFLARVLADRHAARSPETISAILRGRRRI